jgi:hypothetical protein
MKTNDRLLAMRWCDLLLECLIQGIAWCTVAAWAFLLLGGVGILPADIPAPKVLPINGGIVIAVLAFL